ncbi:unnamed protein product [Cylindrotheca closterium]|uniref:Helicase-associated domain-containing protein n=1 Tax=Cylindrotheca closterium TaxID=2856 RepID=A0AAD2FKW4_9STRA|nr:unnamed protein product [Cylindrotheca closterium]
MSRQRSKRRRKTQAALTDEQIRLLDQVDFPWEPRKERFERGWIVKYQELARLYEKDGHPKAVKYQSSLSAWMNKQRRRRFGKGDHKLLTDKQIRLLDTIDFPWAPHEIGWHTKYQALVDFYKEHGHVNVQNGSSLHNWARNQRSKRVGKGFGAPLTREQIRLLDGIGFTWAPTGGPHQIAWQKKYQELAEFYKTYGNLKVKAPSSLYTWMRTQQYRRAGKGACLPLTDEQIRPLDEICFPWRAPRIRGSGGANEA